MPRGRQRSVPQSPQYHPYSSPSPRQVQPQRIQQFACHFYKHNPIQYEQCQRYKLSRVADVTLHFSRCHQLSSEFFCGTCHSFPYLLREDLHVTQTDCQHEPRPEMLSPEEVRQLNQIRAPDDQSKWYAIWHSVFPLHPAPTSPYRAPAIMEAISYLRPVFEAQLPQTTTILDNAFDSLCKYLPSSRHQLSDDSFYSEILNETNQVVHHPINNTTPCNLATTLSPLWCCGGNAPTSMTSPTPFCPHHHGITPAPDSGTPSLIIDPSLINSTLTPTTDFTPFLTGGLDGEAVEDDT